MRTDSPARWVGQYNAVCYVRLGLGFIELAPLLERAPSETARTPFDSQGPAMSHPSVFPAVFSGFFDMSRREIGIRRQTLAAMVFAGSILVVHSIGHAQEKPSPTLYEVGLASVDVTPDHPIRLNGFGGRRDETLEIGERIVASAIAISHASQAPVVLVALDSLGIRLPMVEEVAKRVAISHGLPRENLAITFTHSHCTPKVDGASDTIFSTPIPPDHQEHITRYTQRLTAELTQVVQLAIEDRKPATLAWGVGTVGFAMNRRTPGGPVDHSLPMLLVRNQDESIRAIFATYACHCVTLSYNKINGDWAGYARIAIERKFPGVRGLVSIGCGSDSNPDSGVTGDGEAIAAAQGQLIADEVERLIDGDLLTPLQGAPSATFATLDLPLNPTPTREELEKLAQEASPAGHNARWQLDRWNAGQPPLDHLDYAIQTFRFGEDLAMVFLAGEVCVDYALRLRRELDAERLWLHAYSNDFCAYIPSERLRQEGGYGGGAEIVYFALPSTLAAGLEDRIINEVKSRLPEDWQVPPGTDGIRPSKPSSSLRKFRVREGLKVELVASEPLVDDPVAVDFGIDGRVWVCEMADYARPVDAEFQGSGRVRFLTDTDDDGRLDHSQIFVSGLRFPTDVKAWKDGVLICDAPRVMLARDTDGDGTADDIRTLLEGFATHNPHARVNSLRWSLDGWLHGSGGLFGGTITVRRDDPEGTVVGSPIDLGGRDFRWKPDTGEFEPVTGTTQQGRARDDWNRWFGCDNSTLLRHYPLEQRYARHATSIESPATAIDPTAVDAPGVLYPAGPLVMFALSGAPGRPTSACGLEIFRSTALGDAFEGNAFTCEPVNQLVHRRILSEQVDGSLVARRAPDEQNSEFLTSTDRFFRPVQVRTAPDGSLWIVDMVRYVIEHPQWIPQETRDRIDVFAGQGLGRLWRVVPSDSGSLSTSFPRIDRADDAMLAMWFDEGSGTLRDLIHQRWIWEDRQDLVESRLIPTLVKSRRAVVRAQAWHIVSQLQGMTVDRLLMALADSDAQVVASILPLAEPFLDQEAVRTAVMKVTERFADHPLATSLRIRQAWTLGETSHPDIVQLLLLRLEATIDPYERHAILTTIRPGSASLWRDLALDRSIEQGTAIATDLARCLTSDLSENSDLWFASVSEVVRANSTLAAPHLLDSYLAMLLERQPSRDLLSQEQRQQLGELLGSLSSRALQDLDKADADPTLPLQWIAASLDSVPDLEAQLLERLSPRSSFAVQRGIVTMLSGHPQTDQAALLERLETLSPALQEEAIERWLQRDASRDQWLKKLETNPSLAQWMNDRQKSLLLEQAGEERAQQLRSSWQLPTAASEVELLERYLAVTRNEGDAQRGSALYDRHCAACHTANASRSRLGPDLAALSAPTAESLSESILLPSRDIDAKYRSVAIETSDGRTVVGLLLEEGATSVRIQTSQEASETILRDSIESLATRQVSFMPEGLDRTLSPEDVRDLIAFLKTPQVPAKTFAGNEPRVIVIDEASESFELTAATAEIRGGDIAFEMPFGNIGYWHGNEDHVTWSLEISQAGRYRVTVDSSCADGSAGNRLKLEVAGDILEGEVPATGGWDQYRRWELGQIELTAGRPRLIVRPGAPLSGALCDLRSLRLERLASDSNP